MSQIWKCGYCNATHVTLKKMRKHESKCPSNPGSKLCFSCNNYIIFPAQKSVMRRLPPSMYTPPGCRVTGGLKKTPHPEGELLNKNLQF